MTASINVPFSYLSQIVLFFLHKSSDMCPFPCPTYLLFFFLLMFIITQHSLRAAFITVSDTLSSFWAASHIRTQV